jgi:hypothetical protein
MTTPQAEPQEQDKNPDSWQDCIRLLLDLGGENVIYRGQKRYDWPLLSSLERALLKYAEKEDERKFQLMQGMSADTTTELWIRNVEDALLQRFREQAVRFGIPNLPASWDILGWWEVMQHHGAPTRLMDWTTSPFIAAWFAIDGHENSDGDMALWVYNRSIADLVVKEASDHLKGFEDYLEIDDRQYQNRLVKFGLEKRKMALIPVRPRQFSRAVAQQSVLTVSSAIGIGQPAYLHVRGITTTRIRLQKNWKPGILDTCRSMGFSRTSLFRDLDTLGKSIAQIFEDGLKFFDPYAP